MTTKIQPIETSFRITCGELDETYPDAEQMALALVAIDGRKKARIYIRETFEREITKEAE